MENKASTAEAAFHVGAGLLQKQQLQLDKPNVVCTS